MDSSNQHPVVLRFQNQPLTYIQTRNITDFIGFYNRYKIDFNESKDFYYIGQYNPSMNSWCGLTKDLMFIDVSLVEAQQQHIMNDDIKLVLTYLSGDNDEKQCCLII